MKVIHKYVLKESSRALIMSSLALCALFLTVDFFDRIDNILQGNASVGMALKYFLLKLPQFFTITLPIAMLIATMLSIGLLSKNSEITAMRAAGMKIFWIAKPLFGLALVMSVLSLVLTETVVPYCARRVREIYNIDIKEKDKTGTYSQTNFWWRSGSYFFAVNMFDSRNNTMHDLSRFEVDDDFKVVKRVDAAETTWVKEGLGWTMHDVKQRKFGKKKGVKLSVSKSMALPIQEGPRDFYNVQTDPFTMSFRELQQFIAKQVENGIVAIGYYADLYSKIAFPFVTFVCTFVVLPFALKPARSGSMAVSFIAALIIGFSYYAIHSFSLAMGRAEIWPPLLSAWIANILMLAVGFILNAGAESPA